MTDTIDKETKICEYNLNSYLCTPVQLNTSKIFRRGG